MSWARIASALAIIVEGDGVWTIQARADHRRLRILAVAMVVAAVVGFGAVFIESAAFLVQLAPFSVLGPMLWLKTQPGGQSRVDLVKRTVLVGYAVTPFEAVEGVLLTTGLELRSSRLAPAIGRQVWWLDLLAKGQEPLRLSTSGDEYALFRAALRLSAVLERPLRDHCGPNIGKTTWNSRTRERSRAPEAGRRPDTINERPTKAGPSFQWSMPWGGVVVMALLIGGLGAAALVATYWKLRAPFWSLMATAAFGPPFVRLVALLLHRGRITMVVRREDLHLQYGLPVPRSQTLPREALSTIRVSQKLLAIEPGKRSLIGYVGVQFWDLSKSRLRLELPMPVDEALWLASRLDALANRGNAH